MTSTTATRARITTLAPELKPAPGSPALDVLTLAGMYAPGTIEDVLDYGQPTWRVVVEDNRDRLVTAWQRYDGTWQVDQEAHHPATLDGDDPSIEARDLHAVLAVLAELRVRRLPALDEHEAADRAYNALRRR